MADETAFCIDLNEKHIRMGEAHRVKAGIELVSLGYADAEPLFFSSDTQVTMEKQAEIIAKLHSNLRIKKREVNVIIPDSYTYSRVVEMPRLKEKELIAAIRYQADEFIPMAIDETNLDLEVLKEDEKTNKMLIFIVASPKKLVEKIQRTIELADLIPTTLENELSAVARLTEIFIKKSSVQASTTILINFGYSTTSLYLFDTNSSNLLLSRTFKIGLSLFIKDIIANFNWDEQKATEALRTFGTASNSSMNLDPIVTPIIKEIVKEIERFILISKDRYGMSVGNLYVFNYDNAINSFHLKLQQLIAVPIQNLQLNAELISNPIKQSFFPTLSSFISVIAGNIS